jgi:DNA-binding FrmR family transcriptional regulator
MDRSEHEHNHPNQRKVVNRISRIIGHLEGVKRMIGNGEDCSDILIQISAVRSALDGAAKILLDDHITHCLKHAYEANDTAMIAKLNEAISKFLNFK